MQVTKAFTDAFTAKGYGAQWIPGPGHGVVLTAGTPIWDGTRNGR